MLLISAETSQKNGCFGLKKIFLLSSITCSKKDILFLTDKTSDLSAFQGTGFRAVPRPDDTREIFSRDVSLLLFFRDKLSEKDLDLKCEAEKRHIRTVKFSYMGEGGTDFDIVIDPSVIEYPAPDEDRHFFTGPAYSIMHNRYIHFHGIVRKYAKKTRNILVSMGNSFPYEELRKMSEALLDHGFRVKVIPGDNFKRFHRKTLKRLYPEIRFSGKPESHARAFFESDLAVIDPEGSALRAAATGTPAVYFPRDKEGEKTAAWFENKHAGVIFRKTEESSYSLLIERIRSFPAEERERMGNDAKTVADGKGAYRVSAIIKNYL